MASTSPSIREKREAPVSVVLYRISQSNDEANIETFLRERHEDRPEYRAARTLELNAAVECKRESGGVRGAVAHTMNNGATAHILKSGRHSRASLRFFWRILILGMIHPFH